MKTFFPFILLCLFTHSAFAYNLVKVDGKLFRWCDGFPTLNIDTKTFPDGSSMQASLVAAIEEWNQNPTEFQFGVDFNATGAFDNEDEVVELMMVKATDKGLSGAPAIALWFSFDECLADSDLLFSQGVNWTTSIQTKDLNEYTVGGGRSFQATAMHELGHVVGMHHENEVFSIMGVDWKHLSTNGDSARAFVGGDGKEGARKLYDFASEGSDAELSNWTISNYKFLGKYTKQPEYGDATRTEVFNSLTGAILDSVVYDPVTLLSSAGDATKTQVPFYKVYPGQVVDAEFTFSSAAYTHKTTVDVIGVFSKNNQITSQDEKLMSTDLYCSLSGCVNTFPLEMTVPFTAKPNTVAFLGAIVNPQGSEQEILEYTKNDNATYVPVEIQAPPVAVVFSVQQPVLGSVQKLDHLDSLTVIKDQLNDVQAEIKLDPKAGDGPWHVDWIYYDAKEQDFVHTYNYWPVDEPMIFSLKNLMPQNGEKNLISLRLHNETQSFGAGFSLAGVAFPSASKKPSLALLLTQTPSDGALKSLETNSKQAKVAFTLKANVGGLVTDAAGFKENCQVEFVVSQFNNPKQIVLNQLSTKAALGMPVSVAFEQWLDLGLYTWKARTVCEKSQSAYVQFSGANLHVSQPLDTRSSTLNRAPKLRIKETATHPVKQEVQSNFDLFFCQFTNQKSRMMGRCD
jgi:hypothetical protein